VAELKTRPTGQSVEKFLESIDDAQKREDAFAVLALMRELTGQEPRMWGPSIVGFGQHHYRNASGRGVEWFVAGFSPRKQNLTLYIMPGVERFGTLLRKLGKHKTGKSCLYINRLADVDRKVLRDIIRQGLKAMPPGAA
jgi:hypothetical protein